VSNAEDPQVNPAADNEPVAPKSPRARKPKAVPVTETIATEAAVESVEAVVDSQQAITETVTSPEESAIPAETVTTEEAAVAPEEVASAEAAATNGAEAESPALEPEQPASEPVAQAEPDSAVELAKPKGKPKKAKDAGLPISEALEAPAPKRGFFSWLGGLFGSKKKNLESQEIAEPAEAAKPILPEGLLESDLELSPSAIKKELAKQRREARELNESRERFEAEVSAKTEQAVVFAEQVDQITAWANQVSRTFVWKVQEEMDRNLAQAKSDMASHEDAVNNLKVIEAGRLLKLRQTFHKSLTWALFVCGGLIGAASLIRFRDDIPRLDWLAVLYDPNISGPILVVVLACVIGLIILFSRRTKTEKPKLSRIIWSTFFAILVAWIIWDSSQQYSYMQRVVNPYVDQHYSELVTAFSSIWALWVIGSLISYYRGYSIFNREVEIQILSLKNVIEGYVKTQQEISRLSLLYRQTNDWLEILANALYRPWKTHPDWGTSKEYTNHYETFPYALRVAQAREGADARMQELERIIGSRLLKQGWRNDAFEDLVAQVGTEMGLPPGKFVVDLLDQDLPHQTNNSRNLLKRFLAHSAKTSQAGEVDLGSNSAPPQVGKPEPTDRYLVEVARKRLLDLIEKTQSVAISAARPRVEQIIDDPLLSLRADSAGVDEFDPTESWDEFLTDSLGADSVDKSPLGVLSFTEEGRMKNLPSKVQSYVLVPKRLEKALPNISSESITVVPLGDDRPRSLEIIARIDVVGPADFSAVALLGGITSAPLKAAAPKPTSVDVEEEL
jgi:chemotaxis protein histidine kinase CheA